jgi:deoxyadenosine/deoxycytidine kinase
MARLITIAGPQSSGKTTFLNVLKNRYQSWRFIPEAFSFDKKLELKIIKNELSLLKSLDDKRTTVIETGIFHLVYSEKICGAKIAQNYFKKYLAVYKKFEPLIFFIDTKPEVSWRRRQDKYLDRIKSLGINDEQEIAKRLSKYQKNLYALYPLWLKYLEKIPYQKIIFRNSYIAEDEFIREAFLQFQKFLLQ